MRTIIITAAMLSVSACATYEPPADRDIDNAVTVNQPYEKTWQRATEYFANNNIPISNIAKDSGLIATDYKLGASSTFIDCGTVGTYEAFGDKNLNLNILVKENTPTTTDVRVNVFGTGRVVQTNLYGTTVGAGKAIDCVSTGALEDDLIDYIRAG